MAKQKEDTKYKYIKKYIIHKNNTKILVNAKRWSTLKVYANTTNMDSASIETSVIKSTTKKTVTIHTGMSKNVQKTPKAL